MLPLRQAKARLVFGREKTTEAPPLCYGTDEAQAAAGGGRADAAPLCRDAMLRQCRAAAYQVREAMAVIKAGEGLADTGAGKCMVGGEVVPLHSEKFEGSLGMTMEEGTVLKARLKFGGGKKVSTNQAMAV